MSTYEHHVFVCINERDKSASRPSCGNEDGKKLRGPLKDAIKAAGLKGSVRINESGCLDQCEHAAVMVVYPEAVWYGFVQPRDAEEIVQQHLVGGRPVEKLRLPPACIHTDHCPHRKK
jgi:(2Fe-2S) ferredoxin